MSVGITPYFASGLLGTLRNTPFVVPQTCVQLFKGDPGSSLASNASAITTRMAANFAAPVAGADGMTIATTGTPPSWDIGGLTGPETLSHIVVWNALTGGNGLWVARLGQPQTVVNGDVFTLGGGVSLTLMGIVV